MSVLARLQAVCDAATQGPWRQIADTPWGAKVLINESGEFYVAVNAHAATPTEGWSPEARARAIELGANKRADANHIATFDPPLVASMLAVIEAAWAVRESVATTDDLNALLDLDRALNKFAALADESTPTPLATGKFPARHRDAPFDPERDALDLLDALERSLRRESTPTRTDHQE